MGDRAISSRPSGIPGSTAKTGTAPQAAKPRASPAFNPAAKAILDDVNLPAKAANGAVPAVSLTEDEPITQAEITMSASRHSAETDVALNEAYKALTATLDPADKAKLVTAQKAWITFRDAESTFAADAFRGGSLATTVLFETNAALTEARTADLTGWKAMRDTAGPDGPAAAKDGAAARAATADKALNAVYKQLTPKLDAEGKAKLLGAQRAWLAFRNAECAFAGPAMKDAVLAEMTEARTKQLQTALPEY
jgi:uncharacterized protein YecT (DUF1311 family)